MDTNVPARYGRIVGGALFWASFHALITSAMVVPLTVAAVRFVAFGRGPVMGKGVVVLVTVVADLYLVCVLFMAVKGVYGVVRSRGYPERHWKAVRRALSGSTWMALIAGVVAVWATGSAVLGSATSFWTVHVGWASILDAFALCALFLCVGGVYDVLYHVAVVPYFDKEVGEINVFCHGQHMARHVVALDALARTLGVTPPSEFGWNDDLHGEPLEWHESASGLKTVNALLAHLQAEEIAWSDHAGLIDDLKRIAHALTRASDRGIRFCLLLRHGNTTSGQEWDVRRGTCF